MTTTTQIINNLVVILLNISLWQGRKKLRPEDLTEKGIATESLPPEKLASLGSKRIVSPDAVNVFMALKRRAERACLAVGTRFLGGYAVPEDRMPELQKEMAKIIDEFEKEKKSFLAQYQVTIDAWADENPEWRAAILRAVDSSEYVAQQLQCSYTAMKINPAPGAEKTLDAEVNGLRGQLEKEIAQAAKVAWEESFQGKLAVRQSALGKLETIAEKLAGLSFLNGKIGELHQTVSKVLEQCKGKTPIEGADLMAVSGTLATLMGLDSIRFSSEVEAASFAATVPPEKEPEEETTPEPNEVKPKTTKKRTKKAAGGESKEETPEVTTEPAENHFTDMVAEEPTVPPITKPIMRVNGEEWDNDYLPFGGGEEEIPIVPVAPAAPQQYELPSEWF